MYDSGKRIDKSSMEHTAAGTVQDFHLIPFYPGNEPEYHSKGKIRFFSFSNHIFLKINKKNSLINNNRLLVTILPIQLYFLVSLNP